tara:strand:- start:8254 stop:9780 length:1527 start_codon:yes stop_codon:yes gene_type:complete
MEKIMNRLAFFPAPIFKKIEKLLRNLSSVEKEINKQTDSVISGLKKELKPYSKTFETYSALPEIGVKNDDILKIIGDISSKEESRWKDGFVSGAVYHGDPDHIEFMNKVYALQSQSNPLHSDLFPSASKFESEIVSMTAEILGSNKTPDEICGTVNSGGTESILLAMKTYRDWAKKTKGITRPEMVVPITAHAAFDKAGEYFGIKIIRTEVDENFKADIKSIKKATSRNTIVIVGSAISFPHGVIDPIQELSEFSHRRDIGFHVDACLGGYVLPWAKQLGYNVPDFDFVLPGVTSISVDTHKFGYTAKGTSVILYRGRELRKFQFYTITDWPGGMYFSPTFAGSRAGALSAVCWATLISIGKKGYLDSVSKILASAKEIKQGIEEVPELKILGDPLWVIAFASDELDIYQVMEQMTQKGWNLNGLYKPACIHICVTLRHTQNGVTKRFANDLKESVEWVKENPDEKSGMAPVYGMAANVPLRSIIDDILIEYMDVYYQIDDDKKDCNT